MTIKLDKIDKKILELLQIDSNITNSQLAKEIGLSPAPTLERVKKLEQSNILKSYHAKLNTKELGLGVTIFVNITLSSHKVGQLESFVKKITALPEVLGVYNVTGQGDFLVKIIIEDIEKYHTLIVQKLSQIEEIGNMSSMIVLHDYKPDAIITID